MASTKGTLSNRLLGKRIRPAADLMKPENTDLRARMFPIKPCSHGDYLAYIEAAWLEDGKVRVLARGQNGDIAHVWLMDGLIEVID